MSNETENKPPLDTWAIVEAMGHRRYVGHVVETTLAGAPILRIDVPEAGDEHQQHTVFLAPSALYALTPVSEVTALALVGRGDSAEPIQPWAAERLLAQPAEVVDEADRVEGGDYGPPDDDDGRPF